MAKKKYFKNTLNTQGILRENKSLPTLSLDTDPSMLFGVGETPHRHKKFADVVEETIANTTFSAILQEKERKTGKVVPVNVKIKSSPPPQAELDLHGFTAREAATAADSFIQRVRNRKYRTARIITGKGLHSRGGPVLRDIIDEKLITWKSEGLILAFQWEKHDKLRSGSVVLYF